MPSYPKNYPFYNWVPKPVGIIILFVFFLPILTVGGTYSVASTEMMSELGIISEHIQFANFATSIGMAAFCPFLYRLVVIRRQKMMCLAGFSLMYIFSYICAKTDSVFLVAPPKKVHKCFSHMKTLELEIVQGFFFYPHYAFRYIFVKLDFANSVAFFKAFEKAINMYHTSLFFNCLTIPISGVKK